MDRDVTLTSDRVDAMIRGLETAICDELSQSTPNMWQVQRDLGRRNELIAKQKRESDELLAWAEKEVESR